jgi:mRNA interferase MazF
LERLPLRPIVAAELGTGLRERSQIMTDRMLALRRDRIRGAVGTIDASASEQLDRALLMILGLGR